MVYREMVARAPYEAWIRPWLAEANAKNAVLLEQRQRGILAKTEMDQGDFVRVGTELLRVAHVWDDSVQLTRAGSFHVSKDGFCSFSGSLERGIPKERFSRTDETERGPCWFFSEDHATGHNGFDTSALFRVWNLDTPQPDNLETNA